jgi:hypothetical protein
LSAHFLSCAAVSFSGSTVKPAISTSGLLANSRCTSMALRFIVGQTLGQVVKKK